MAEENKKWYKSKTVIVNLLAVIALVVQLQFGFAINPEEQAAIIVVINLILRAVTKKGLEP